MDKLQLFGKIKDAAGYSVFYHQTIVKVTAAWSKEDNVSHGDILMFQAQDFSGPGIVRRYEKPHA